MNLLLVDDEAFALEALEHAINWKSLGIDQVFTCGNIKAARQICQESDIQIMICDIEMPNGTGLDLAKWLSENYPDLLILFLTCHSDFSFAKEAISYHAFAYLLKPFDIEEISQAVKEAVQQSRNRQKLNRSLFASQPPERLLASEHFWLQLVSGSYQNSDADYILWDASRNSVFFDKDAHYVPCLFYISSLPSENTDLGVLSYCVKNALNEFFAEDPGWPPAIEPKPCFFLSFVSPDLFLNREAFDKYCSRSKVLSKLLKTFDKTFREIFPVFISTKRREKPSAFFDNNFVNNAYFSEAASSSSSHLASSSSKAPISSRMTCLCLWSS